MHRGWFAAGIVGIVLLAGAGRLWSGNATHGGKPAALRPLTNDRTLGPNAVVVELFTSQG